MKKYLIVLLCFILCGCNVVEEKPQLNEQQLQCEHEWVEIDWNFEILSSSTYDIYCPKCELEMEVSFKQWNRLQADMEHRNNN